VGTGEPVARRGRGWPTAPAAPRPRLSTRWSPGGYLERSRTIADRAVGLRSWSLRWRPGHMCEAAGDRPRAAHRPWGERVL